MKILRIIVRLNIGGPARNAVLLSEGLPETVLVCGEVGKAEGDMAYIAREKGIVPVIVPELARELSWKDDWTAFWKIYKIICREKPDIIHTHTAKAGALGRLAGILYNLFNKPRRLPSATYEVGKVILVHTFHGHVFSGYFGKFKTLFFIWVERFLALFTDKIITVSASLKKELVGTYRIAPERKIEVIELGFELDELFKLLPRQNSEIINIGIIGRLVPIKNHKMVLDCVRNLKQHVRSNSIRIVIVGDGEMREELERYAGELGLTDLVEFRGWVKDLKAIYEGLDIVALTSLNEGTPVSIIEAMAAARPVVATNVGGVPDIVQDGKTGYLVESGDIEGFTRKLTDLIKDPVKRREFGQSARNAVKCRFTKERLIKETERLYNNILQKNKKN
ncbi:MAG: glycosyltransferase family 4 protein [Candidatus Omnitrophota bacterium]|nr:glycosyltransferase family 4 protein [Candidatus Omnitrophota bacterium]